MFILLTQTMFLSKEIFAIPDELPIVQQISVEILDHHFWPTENNKLATCIIMQYNSLKLV